MMRRRLCIEELMFDGIFGVQQILTLDGVLPSRVLEEAGVELSQLVDLIAALLRPESERRRLPEPPRHQPGVWRVCATIHVDERELFLLYDLKARTISMTRPELEEPLDAEGHQLIESLLTVLMDTPAPPPRHCTETERIAWLLEVGLMLIDEPMSLTGRHRYVPLRLLRRDPFTETRLAFDLERQRHVWLRALREPWTRTTSTRLAFLRAGRTQTEAEACCLPVLEMGHDGQGAWHVLPQPVQLSGARTLRELRGAPLLDIIRWATQCVRAMKKASVVHGRLELDTFVFHEGEVWLCDIGLGRAIFEAAPAALRAEVSPSRWAAPEVIAGEPPDIRSDIFSFGAALGHLVEEQSSSVFEEMTREAPERRPAGWRDVRFTIR